jgi:formyl-CoA transferase
MQDPATGDQRFADMAGRCIHDGDVDVIVERWTRSRTNDEISAILTRANIPNAPVIGLADLLNDPHTRERGVLRNMSDESGDWLTLGSPLFLSDSPIVEPTRAPLLGADTRQILSEDLGMSGEEIDDLYATGAI